MIVVTAVLTTGVADMLTDVISMPCIAVALCGKKSERIN